MQHNGKFITIEGIDCCGKSVLITNITKTLRKQTIPVLSTKEPGGSELGKQIRPILQAQEQPVTSIAEYLLFAADRAQHFSEVIIPALLKGTMVISDRCADSSVAYQGFGAGIDTDMIAQVNTWVMQGIEPDLVLYLDVSIDVAFERLKKRNSTLTAFEKRDRDFWNRVQQGYESLFTKRSNVVRIDANQSEQAVLADALSAIEKL